MKSLGDSIVDYISPQDGEDEGTGCKEVEDGDFDPANHERKAENLQAGNTTIHSSINKSKETHLTLSDMVFSHLFCPNLTPALLLILPAMCY